MRGRNPDWRSPGSIQSPDLSISDDGPHTMPVVSSSIVHCPSADFEWALGGPAQKCQSVRVPITPYSHVMTCLTFTRYKSSFSLKMLAFAPLWGSTYFSM